MRRTIIFVIAIIFAVALLARAATYTVRFTETAVLTTFGSAGPDSVQREPGLRFKWPDPIQSVTKYDTRARFLQSPPVTQQTADQRHLVVEAFCTWRVDDPLKFFQRFSNAGDRSQAHYEAAERLLRGNLRAAMGETSRYRLNELFTPRTDGSKLPELEARILRSLVDREDEELGMADYGIEIVDVGISRVILPEETTSAVMESMREDRNRLVAELESRGEAQRQAIITAAQAHADRIESFARAYAAEIRLQGDLEAQEYIAQMNERPDLAVFLKNVEFLRTAMAKRVTWIVNNAYPGFEIMSPQNVGIGSDGLISGVSGLMGDDEVRRALAAQLEESAESEGEEEARGSVEEGEAATALRPDRDTMTTSGERN